MRKIWWTWDIRMRWSYGFSYFAKSFEDNYLAMIDSAAAMGVDGIVIWGFLRDRHGGVDSARRIVDHAVAKGVKIYPGVGIDDYGGVYYDGDSTYALDSYIKQHPEAQAIREDGTPDFHLWPPNDTTPRLKACPSNEEVIAYYQESVEWLLDTFNLEGFQIEQGDSGLCWCPKCRERKRVSPQQCARADLTAASVRIPAVVKPILAKRPGLTIITETYAGLTYETLKTMAPLLKNFPEQLTMSWQCYDGYHYDGRTGVFKFDAGIKSPTLHGNAALRTNNDLFLGEIDDRENIKKALAMSKSAGLDMTYIYGEYPSTWPVTRRNYECWIENA